MLLIDSIYFLKKKREKNEIHNAEKFHSKYSYYKLFIESFNICPNLKAPILFR